MKKLLLLLFAFPAFAQQQTVWRTSATQTTGLGVGYEVTIQQAGTNVQQILAA